MSSKGGWVAGGWNGYASKQTHDAIQAFVQKWPEVVADIETYNCTHCLAKEGERCRTYCSQLITFWHMPRRKMSKYYDGRGNLVPPSREGGMNNLAMYEESLHEWLEQSDIGDRIGHNNDGTERWDISLNKLKLAINGLMVQYASKHGSMKPVATLALVKSQPNVPEWLMEHASLLLVKNQHWDSEITSEMIDAARRRLDLLITLEGNADKLTQLLVEIATKNPDEFDKAVEAAL